MGDHAHAGESESEHDVSAPEHELESLFDAWRSRGDMTALASAFDAAAPELLAIARFLARNEAEAEDYVQATFLAAIERAETFDASRNWRPWLVGILALHARNERRKSARVIEGSRIAQRVPEDPEREAQNVELHEALDRAVASLPETYARPLRMHLEGDLSPREIAAELALAAGTVRVRLHRGLRMLRETLPPGFALGIVATGSLPRGLGVVRASVLQTAAQHAPLVTAGAASATPPIVGASTKLWVATLIALVAGGGVWFAIRRAALAGGVYGQPVSALEPNARIAEPTLAEATLVTEADPGVARTSANPAALHSESLGQEVVAMGEAAQITGRLLRPDGQPAASARVELKGFAGMSELSRQLGSPGDWIDPSPITADVDGRFHFAITPPLVLQFTLDATLAGCAKMIWRWRNISGKQIDLGDVRFEPACSLVVRIVDASGNLRAGDYRVEASPPFNGSAFAGRAPVSVRETYDTATREHRIEGIPPGRIEVRVESDLGGWLPTTLVDVSADEAARVDVLDDSPPSNTRITVMISTSPFHSFRPELEHILAHRGDLLVPHAEPLNQTSDSYVFEDLQPGEYVIEIDDPRFERWTQTNVKSGQAVKAKLRGAAAVTVSVRDAQTHERVEPYSLQIDYVGGTFSPHAFDLRKPGAPSLQSTARAEATYGGIVPGSCELVVKADGYPEQHIDLGQLRARETRIADIQMLKALSVRGVALRSGERGPANGVVIEITRGSEPGVAVEKGSFFFAGDPVTSKSRWIAPVTSSTRSAADGMFAFENLAPGAWTLRAVWSPWLVTDRMITLEPNHSAPIDLIEPPSGWLEGRVIVPDGAVTEGFEMSLSPSAAGVLLPAKWLSGRADDPGLIAPEGRFRFGPLPVGTVEATLLVRTPGAIGSTATQGAFAELAIETGKTTERNFDLRTTMPARIQVAALVDGLAIAHGRADCWRDPSDPAQAHAMTAFSPGGGSTLISGLDPGAWRLVITEEQQHWSWIHPAAIELKPGQQVDLLEPIALATHEIRCTDERDASLLAQHALIAVTGLAEHETKLELTTNESGMAKLKLPIGPVTFRDPTTNASATLDWGRDAASPLDVRLRTRD